MWSFRSAEKRFGELVDRALAEGPQFISRGGRQAVVVAKGEFLRAGRERPNLVEFFRRSPLVGVDLDLTRDRGAIRRFDL